MAILNERILIAPATRVGGRAGVVSPFQFVTTGEDSLRVKYAAPATGTLALVLRTLADDNTIQVHAYTLTIASAYVLHTTYIPLTTGSIINMAVSQTSSSSSDGAPAFVAVELVRGTDAAAQLLGVLMQGYCRTLTSLSYPGSLVVGSTDGPGWPRQLAFANPAAGAEFSAQVSPNTLWRLRGFRIKLITSAVVGNRQVGFFASHPVFGTHFVAMSTELWPAGTAVNLHWNVGAAKTDTAIAASHVTTLPANIVLNGVDGPMTVGTTTVGRQAGDLLQSVSLLVDEWVLLL
jgi:hypothetical protein